MSSPFFLLLLHAFAITIIGLIDVLVHPFKILFRPLFHRSKFYQTARQPRKVNARGPGRSEAETLQPIQVRTQVKRDFDYYNKHYNPGDPIEYSYNLDMDLEEMNLPTEYLDLPPDAELDEPDDET